MSDQELRTLVANLAAAQAEAVLARQEAEHSRQDLERIRKETDRMRLDAERFRGEIELRFHEQSERQVREAADRVQREFERARREAVWLQQESERIRQETDASRQERLEAHRQAQIEMRQLRKQLGEIGNKFGSFTDGMAWPAMQRILQRRFKAEVVAADVRQRRGPEEIQLDVLAYRQTAPQAAWVVEVKSHLRQRDLEQVLRILERFPDWFPEHADKELYGVLAVVDTPPEDLAAAQAAGIHVARIHDEQFRLVDPPGFIPRSYRRV